MALLDRIRNLLNRPSAQKTVSDAVSGVNANAANQAALLAVAPIAGANVATNIANPIGAGNLANETVAPIFAQEVVQGTATQIINPADFATQTAQSVPQVNTIPPVEQQNQGFIQEPVETVDFIPPAIIPETGIELGEQVGDTYDYSSVTPTEAANASALVALEAAEEIEERQKDSVIGNLKFFFKDLEVGINQIRSGDGERTSSRSFLQSDGTYKLEEFQISEPSIEYGVEKKSIKEISVINKLINDEFLPENKQRILDEEFGVGKMTVSDFQKDFLPKWFDFYGTDSKYIDTKAQVEEKYGLTPVQYLKKSNDLKILERNYVKNLTDSLYADMSKDADPETYALFAQQVVDGFKTQFSDVKSSIIKLEGLAENQSFTSAFYSKEEIKEGVKNSYQILDTYKNKWIEYHKYFREGEDLGKDGNQYALGKVYEAGYKDLNGFLANDKSNKIHLNLEQKFAIMENSYEIGTFRTQKDVEYAKESWKGTALYVTNGALDILRAGLNGLSILGTRLRQPFDDLLEALPIIGDALKNSNGVGGMTSDYAQTDSGIGLVRSSSDPASTTNRFLTQAKQNIPDLLYFVANVYIGNKLAAASSLKNVGVIDDIVENMPRANKLQVLNQGVRNFVNTVNSVYIENVVASSAAPTLGLGQTNEQAYFDMFFDFTPVFGLVKRLKLGSIKGSIGDKLINVIAGDANTGLSPAYYQELVKTKGVFDALSKQNLSSPADINFKDTNLVKAVQDLIEAEKGQSFAKLSDAEAGLYKQNIRTAEAAILDISKQDPATGNAMAKIILGPKVMQDNIVDFVKETVRLGGIPTEENLDKLTRVQKLINEMTVDNKFNVADMIRSVYQLDAVTFAGYYAGVKVGNTAIGVGGSVKQYIIPQAVKDIIGSKSLSEPLTPEEINALSLGEGDIIDNVITAQGRERLGIKTTQDYVKSVTSDSDLDSLLDDAVENGIITQEFADNNKELTTRVSDILSKIIC